MGYLSQVVHCLTASALTGLLWARLGHYGFCNNTIAAIRSVLDINGDSDPVQA